jgi:hypothetical protein
MTVASQGPGQPADELLRPVGRPVRADEPPRENCDGGGCIVEVCLDVGASRPRHQRRTRRSLTAELASRGRHRPRCSVQVRPRLGRGAQGEPVKVHPSGFRETPLTLSVCRELLPGD